ncbi:perlucin-like protein [Mercenaria mercenaria]|uniref:perlucin-like protein n=1 Tax=Mercenaria mercenaria TaxID=6596 RepID=UPI00234E8CFB|nr:perlucin-like protein [Mercenaria mercenaria]
MVWLAITFHIVLLSAAAQCPSGWMRHEDSCYHFSHDTEPWMLAQEVCKTFGGTLADITSQKEDVFLQNEVQRLKVNHWVGGNDLMNEGEWQWINTNEDFSYTNWKVGEPNSRAHNENCLDLRVIPGWNDERCDISQFYICEKSDEDVSIVG